MLRYTSILAMASTAAFATPPMTIHYTCADGRTVIATYPDQTTALLNLDGQTLTLAIAPSADGARYVGHSWQWWSKGMSNASLARLAPGEAIASARGTQCHAAP